MASSNKEKARQDEKKKAVSQQDDDVIGKAYDGRLIRRWGPNSLSLQVGGVHLDWGDSDKR